MEQADNELTSLIGGEPQIKRKYLAEAGLHLFTEGPTMLRPSDLYGLVDHPYYRARLEGANIYLICRRRRISICPQSIAVKDGELFGKFIVHGDSYFEWQTEHFSPGRPHVGQDGHALRFDFVRPADPFGHAVEAISENGGRTIIPSGALVAMSNHKLGDRTKLEVLYVGQSFGKAGERISVDRLKRHTTFQKILSNCVEESGNDEIFLLAFQYGSSKNWMSTAGDRWIEPTATWEEERSHMEAVGQRKFDRKVRVLLAEAALINYFKPRYNEMHRDSFIPHNNRKLKTLKKLFEADMSALMVEINTSNIRAKLWSPRSPRRPVDTLYTPQRIASMRANALKGDSPMTMAQFDDWINEQTHALLANFELYDKSERETFLNALPWQCD